MDRYSKDFGRFKPSTFELGATHSGKGPKGYKRSDEKIREDVCERLAYSHEIDASGFEVNVSEGIVTLEGLVDGRQEKRLAEDLIEDLPGVVDIHNHLTVEKKVDGWVPRRAIEPEQPAGGP